MQRDLKYICSNLRNQGNKRLEDLTLTVGSVECVSSEMKGKPWIMSKDDLNFLFSPLLLVQQEQQKEMFDVFVCVWTDHAWFLQEQQEYHFVFKFGSRAVREVEKW